MKLPLRAFVAVFLLVPAMQAAFAQASKFQHVIVVVQENRSPDNLFHDTNLISVGADISLTGTYKNSSGSKVTVNLAPVVLNSTFGLEHSHKAFTEMYDGGAMDGANLIPCTPEPGTTCPPLPQFTYVDNSTGTVQPYFALAEQYGFANRMFQTNQGPSFPAHQFLFSGTSAPVEYPQHYYDWFAAANTVGDFTGCTAPTGTVVQEINRKGQESPGYNGGYPCYEHPVLPDLFPQSGSTNWWTYYTVDTASIWTAPDAISHICGSTGPSGQCEGTEWKQHVSVGSQIGNLGKVLSDIQSCSLPKVSWVIPNGPWSDHPSNNTGLGPAWVADIVDEIGNSFVGSNGKCDYWGTQTNDTTAILITWDDWGGWYDHVPPKAIGYPDGTGSQYVYGFRVPLIVVSAYTRQTTPLGGYISEKTHDFGSILRFIEDVYGLGTINPTYPYADQFADDLTDFFDYTRLRTFTTIPSPYPPSYFINYTGGVTAPDED